MSDSVTVTTCLVVKFQHRGAPCILMPNTKKLPAAICGVKRSMHERVQAVCLRAHACVNERVSAHRRGRLFKTSEWTVLTQWRSRSAAACVSAWPGQRQAEDLCHSESEVSIRHQQASLCFASCSRPYFLKLLFQTSTCYLSLQKRSNYLIWIVLQADRSWFFAFCMNETWRKLHSSTHYNFLLFTCLSA